MSIESTINTYRNAKALRVYLLLDYLRARITTIELIKGIKLVEQTIMSACIILSKHGMDKSR